MALPAPIVPLLTAENWIDLDQLGNRDLETYLNYPGIANGDFVFPNWRGCGAQGEVEDVADFRTQVVNVTPQGFLFAIDNAKLRNLDQGWVFYSFHAADPNDDNLPGDESLRLFFYVGARELTGAAAQLAVPQVRESHDLQIVLDEISVTATVIVAPYKAMSEGDKVTLSLELYFEEDDRYKTLTLNKPLTAADIDRPLQWAVAKNELQIIEDGFVRASYSIDYADPTRTTTSPIQQLAVVRSLPEPRLPAPSIVGFEGDQLDPNQHPNGIAVRVPPWAGMRVSDGVLLHAAVSSKDLHVEALTLDLSSIDSGVLLLRLGPDWLMASNGLDLELTWQYARPGASGSSEPLALVVRRPLKLPAPSVERAIDEDPVDGVPHAYLVASQHIVGDVYVNIPADADYGPQDQPQMHWLGHPNGSVVVLHPVVGSPRRFQVPSWALAANMDKRVKVFYQVTPPAGAPVDSAPLSLGIVPMTEGWPAIQLREPPYSNPLRLSDVPASGALFRLPPWSFMGVGQLVRIIAQGLDSSSRPIEEIMRNALPVTAQEYADGELHATLSKAYMQRLRLDSPFTVSVHTSFDAGDSWVEFRSAEIQLVA